MKVGVGPDDLRHLPQREAALSLDSLQGFEIWEMTIGEWFISQGPQPLSRLRLWRIWRQQVQVYACRYLHLWTHVPSCAIADQEDLPAVPSAHGVGKFGRGTTRDVRSV